MIVRHVLSVTRGGDWPVQRDAFDGTTDEVVFDPPGGFLARVERLVTPSVSDTQVREAEVGGSADDIAERVIDDRDGSRR